MPKVNLEKTLIQPGYVLIDPEVKDEKAQEFIVDNKSDFVAGKVVDVGNEDAGAEHDTLHPHIGNRVIYRTYGNDNCELNGKTYHLVPTVQIAFIESTKE